MMKINTDESLKFIDLESSEEKVLKHLDDKFDMSSLRKSITNDHTNIIFPVCGKRCFNCVDFIKSNKAKEVNSEYAQGQSWDLDGSENKRSSVQVLIDWITTEENCSQYFGGLDADGRTNGNRKDTYHYIIRDLIKIENGEILHYKRYDCYY